MEEGEVVGGFAVAAGCDAAFRFQPGVGAFDGEALAGLPVGCLGVFVAAAPDGGRGLGGGVCGSAAFADPRFDVALAEGSFEAG